MTDQRDPFAGALAAPQALPPEDATERRIPFTPDDERRIKGVALWTKIVGIVTICSASLSGLVNLASIILLPFDLLGTIRSVVSFLFTFLLGLFLLMLPTLVPALSGDGALAPLFTAALPIFTFALPLSLVLELLCAPLLAICGVWLGIRPSLKEASLGHR